MRHGPREWPPFHVVLGFQKNKLLFIKKSQILLFLKLKLMKFNSKLILSQEVLNEFSLLLIKKYIIQNRLN